MRIPVDDLVINIGDIHHKHHIIIKVVTKHTHNDILAQICPKNYKTELKLPGMSHMCYIINSRSTTVPQHLTRLDSNKRDLHFTKAINKTPLFLLDCLLPLKELHSTFLQILLECIQAESRA